MIFAIAATATTVVGVSATFVDATTSNTVNATTTIVDATTTIITS